MQPFSAKVKPEMAPLQDCYNLAMPNFALAQSVAGNVRALRKALGSAVRELSREDLGRLISAEHPDRRPINSTTVGRWESGKSEPDLHSLRIMARLAGVGLEQFAFGGGTIHTSPLHYPGVPQESGDESGAEQGDVGPSRRKA
jgi:transcriptional regulator with XRE-family HTH domain